MALCIMATVTATHSPPFHCHIHPQLLFHPSMDPNNMEALMHKVLAGMMDDSNTRLVCLLCLFAFRACLFDISGISFDILHVI